MKPVLPTYVLVVNRASATVFKTQGRHTAPVVVERFDHPEGRLKSGEIDSDRPGRAFDGIRGGQHALSHEESPVERVAHAFALQLSEHLDGARARGEFDELFVIAPPRMLGYLRDAFSAPTRAIVRGELAKDLNDPSPEDLVPYLDQLASA